MKIKKNKPTAELFENHDIRRKDGSVPKIQTRVQYVIWKLVENPENVNWAKEGKFASKLLKQFPIMDYWFSLKNNKKYYSVWNVLQPENLFYITQDYEKFMKDSFTLSKCETYSIAEEKVGEDLKETSKKPKTILDFLRG